MSVVYIWFRLGFRLHWVEALYCGTSYFWHKVFKGSNQSPLFDLQCYYRVKSVSLVRFTRFLQGQIISLFRFTRFLQGQISPSFSIYKVFTGWNQSPFFDLQCYYKVKSVTRFRFTRFLQGQIGLSSSIYKFFTGSNQSPFFDFRYFYNVEWFHPFSIYRVFT